MSMKKFLIMTAVFCTALTFTHSAHAYKTSDQTAVQYSETKSLYTITYSFGHTKYDLYLPIAAVRDLPYQSQTNALGYEIVEDDTVTNDATDATAVVLSDADIVDTMYRIPAGAAATFTFIALLTTEPTDLEADYKIQITDLPFYRGEDRQPQALNVHELSHYVTPELEFNESNTSKN